MDNFYPNKKTWVNLKTLRDPSNKKVQELLTELSKANKLISEILKNEQNDFIVTCNMVDEFCKLIYDPIILATIKNIRISFFKFLLAISDKNSFPIWNLINIEWFNFYFASHLVIYLAKIWKDSLNRSEAKKILSLSSNIVWNQNILSVFLTSIKPWELDDELLWLILKNESKCFIDKKVIWLLFEKIWKEKINKSHITQIFGKLNEDLISNLNWIVIYFNLLELV